MLLKTLQVVEAKGEKQGSQFGEHGGDDAWTRVASVTEVRSGQNPDAFFFFF